MYKNLGPPTWQVNLPAQPARSICQINLPGQPGSSPRPTWQINLPGQPARSTCQVQNTRFMRESFWLGRTFLEPGFKKKPRIERFMHESFLEVSRQDSASHHENDMHYSQKMSNTLLQAQGWMLNDCVLPVCSHHPTHCPMPFCSLQRQAETPAP